MTISGASRDAKFRAEESRKTLLVALLLVLMPCMSTAQSIDAAHISRLEPTTWTQLRLGRLFRSQEAVEGSTLYLPPFECTAHVVSARTNVPVTRPYNSVAMTGDGRYFYFGGGHTGYPGNDVWLFTAPTGRWSQSTYDISVDINPTTGCSVGAGDLGPSTPPPSGRPWWESTMAHMAWDNRQERFAVVHTTGTWFYDPTGESWLRITRKPPGGLGTFLGGGWDADVMVFDPDITVGGGTGTLRYWSVSGGIYHLDYGSGPSDFTGAHWVFETDVSTDPTYDADHVSDSDMVYDPHSQKIIYVRSITADPDNPDGSFAEGTDLLPQMWGYDPGTHSLVAIDLTTGPTSIAVTGPGVFASLTYHTPTDEILLLQSDTSGQIVLWALQHDNDAPDQWRQITDLTGLAPTIAAVAGTPVDQNTRTYPAIGHSVRLMHYDPASLAIYFFLRSGGGAARRVKAASVAVTCVPILHASTCSGSDCNDAGGCIIDPLVAVLSRHHGNIS